MQCQGKGPGFLQEIRLGFACRLLKENEKNISEIMQKSGFQNQAYFNKLFVETMNVTPKKYRKLHEVTY